jgi:SpoIID/LytB domain protein
VIPGVGKKTIHMVTVRSYDEMKKILVTGGAGFIGSHLCERLLAEGNEIICLDNLSTGSQANIRHLLNNKYFQFVEHDLIEPFFVEVDEIYNLACPASPLHYQADPIKTIKTCVYGVVNMLELAEKTGAKILQASTSEVYGDPKLHPQPETCWGKWNYAHYRDKIRQAIEETKGQVLIYKGQLIDPVYHASCGGKCTESSVEVWKFDVPYLQGVSCTGHQDRHNSTSLFFTLENCDNLLGTKLAALPASKFQKEQAVFQIKEKSSTGRIKTAAIGGKAFSGTELRTQLNLPSTRFDCKKGNNGLYFISNGYGHGVGMCQYGAADLATAGKSYQEILQHYYTGAQMARLQ